MNIREQFREKNLKEWEEVIKRIFTNNVPEFTEWSNSMKIKDV